MHFMAVKTEQSEIRQITQYLIILDMGAVLEHILFIHNTGKSVQQPNKAFLRPNAV